MFPLVSAYEVEYDLSLQFFYGSMFPTLEMFDLVYVKNVSGQAEVYASYGDGDIILFQRPIQSNMLAISRAVEKFESDSTWYFKTKQDYNTSPDPWDVPESDVIGKIVALSRVETVDSHNVTVFSTSAFTDFHLNLTLNALEVDVAALLTQSSPSSFLNVTIPNELVTGDLDVMVDGFSIVFEHSANSTYHFVWFDWEGADYAAYIVLPEFSSAIGLLLLIGLATLTAVFVKRKHIT